MRLDQAVEILKKAGAQIPYNVQKEVLRQQREREGIAQIWICKKCPGFVYNAPIRCLAVTCRKGHFAELMWSMPKK